MRAIQYHPAARDEFLRQVVYYSDVSTRLAERYDKAVHKAEVQAAEAPEQWPPYKFKKRRVIDRHADKLVKVHLKRGGERTC